MKDTNKKIKRQTTDWEKYLQNTYLIKEYIRIYKELSNFNNKKTNKKWGKYLNRYYLKEDILRMNKRNKRYSISLEKRKIKPQWTHLERGEETNTDNIKMVARIGNYWETAGRNAKRYSHIGRQFVNFFEIKHNLTIQPSNPTLGIYPSDM